MKNWVILDRDGTLNQEVHLLREINDLKLIPESAKAIKLLNRYKLPVIVVTNQSVIARGLSTEEDVESINKQLINLLRLQGAKVDRVYYCPHSPKGEIKKYRLECACRKPKPGMIFQAAKEFSLDPKDAYLVGDMARDILAGQNAKTKATILVSTGHGGKDDLYKAIPDYKTANLYQAAKLIIKLIKSN